MGQLPLIIITTLPCTMQKEHQRILLTLFHILRLQQAILQGISPGGDKGFFLVGFLSRQR